MVRQTSIRQRCLTACSVVTTLVALVIAALLMGSHTPFLVAQAQSGLAERTGRWHAVHILGSECPCSARVAEYLSHRRRFAGLDERVIHVSDQTQDQVGDEAGDDPDIERSLREAGWQVEQWSAERVRDYYGALSAPLLIIVDPDGVIRYAGGYSNRSDARDGFHDAEIWNALQAGHEVQRLPAFGCALTFGCSLGGVQQAIKRIEGSR
jgi:hypothetical protein